MASMDAILRVTAKGDASGLTGLVRGLESVKAAGANVSKSLGGIGSILGTVTGGALALGAGLSAASLVTFAKGAIDAADNMRDLSQQTGASVENLSRFQQAANMSGTNIEAVGGAMVKLSRGMAEAAATGKGPASEALRTLGISAVDAAGGLRGADQVMLDVAQRFQQMPDGAGKAALAVQLFGRSGADLIPMLNEGRQAIEGLDAAMTTAFAEKADDYNDSLAAMGVVFGQIGMAIAEQFLPYLSSAVDWLTKVGIGIRDWIVANERPIRQTIETIGTIGAAIAPWVLGIGLVITAYNALTLATKAWATASAVAQALNGPKGWAAVLVGLGLATLATRAVAGAMEAASSSAAGAELEAKKAAAAIGQIGITAAEVPPQIDNAKQQQEAFKVAVDRSNSSYELLGRTIDATAQQVQRQGRIQQETFTADIAINNAAKSILEAKLSQARTDAEKIPILKQIQGIELENARLQRDAATARIQEEVQIADLKRQNAWADLRSIQAAVDMADAMGQQTDQLRQQLALRKVAANESDRDFRAAQEIAALRQKANQANFQGQQAQILSRQITPSGGGSDGAQRNPAGGLRPMGYVNGVPYWQQQPIGFATGAYVTGPTMAQFGEAGPEYAIPASKMQSASMAYLSGARGAAVLQGGTGTGGTTAPRITVQTGPVMRMDGQDWVSMADLEQAMRATAAGVLGQLRSPSGRVAMGGA